MKMKLKKDIVIPAGTVFENCDGCSVRYGEENYETIIGLTKDSYGTLVYCMEPMDKKLPEWFEEVK